MNIVILGLSITSSWGNGHATTYRALVHELNAQGHAVTFLECDAPWYAVHRDLAQPPWCETHIYEGLDQLRRDFTRTVTHADAVIVGSFVPDGIAVGEWVQTHARGVTAFYDIDTPATLAALKRGQCEYLSPRLIPGYDVYLSFTGGPTLQQLEREWGAPRARALYCSFDPRHYFPEPAEDTWDIGYLGTFSDDRQPRVESLLLEPARQLRDRHFIVAGAMYPSDMDWPPNVEYRHHIPPDLHRDFYTRQRFTLNVTRDDMRAAGFSPSVRLFEAAACATPIISDRWPGIEQLFEPGREILLADDTAQVVAYLTQMPHEERHAIGRRAHERVMAEHTAAHRAAQLVEWLTEAADARAVA